MRLFNKIIFNKKKLKFSQVNPKVRFQKILYSRIAIFFNRVMKHGKTSAYGN